MAYSIYVIELKKGVLKHKKFKEANPNYIPGKPCVYVGYTSKTPEDRYEFPWINCVVAFIIISLSEI